MQQTGVSGTAESVNSGSTNRLSSISAILSSSSPIGIIVSIKLNYFVCIIEYFKQLNSLPLSEKEFSSSMLCSRFTPSHLTSGLFNPELSTSSSDSRLLSSPN